MLQTPAGFRPLISAAPAPGVRTFLVGTGAVLLREHDLALPDAACLATLDAPPGHPIGEWEGHSYQVALAPSLECAVPGYRFMSLRSLFGVLDDGLLALAGRASQIAEWVRTHRYCGVCATRMALAGGERAFKCPACGFTAYPRISPAMMVLVRKGDAVLLARHTNSPYQRFTALAGFLEAGESVEEAVHREVYEEVGLRVHNLKYFGSQSWPFPHSLMIAFTADYLDGEIRVDETEIAEARWFGPGDDFPDVPPGVSIATALINAHRP